MGWVQSAMFNNECQVFQGIDTDSVIGFGFGSTCFNVRGPLQLSPESKKVMSKYAMASGSHRMSWAIGQHFNVICVAENISDEEKVKFDSFFD